jgi:hypothetical protein
VSFIADLFTGAKGASKAVVKAADLAKTENNALATRIYDQTQGQIQPYIQNAPQYASRINAFAGFGTPEQQAEGEQGFENYLKNFGYDRELMQGSRAITGSQAARGMLGSGATLKGLQGWGLGLRDKYRGNYLNLLTDQQGVGLQATGLGAAAGQNYVGQATQNNNNYASAVGNAALARSASNTNFLSGLISAGAAAFSDVRLKRDIEKLGEFEDGLGLYGYRYAGESARQIGVMAHEVSAFRPWALGPEIEGFSTVNYGDL